MEDEHIRLVSLNAEEDFEGNRLFLSKSSYLEMKTQESLKKLLMLLLQLKKIFYKLNIVEL